MDLIKINAHVVLKKGRESSVLRRHPWIFSGAIHQIKGTVAEGCWVSVEEANGNILGYGHYQKGSIMVRMLTFGAQAPGPDFYAGKFAEALALRKAVGLPGSVTNCYRLIHGEGDGLSGLIIDCYDGAAVVQAHSAGMHADRHLIGEGLSQLYGGALKAVYYKEQNPTADSPSGYLAGACTVPHTALEYGNKFLVDWEEGQKTGFFLDQRENRKLLASFSQGKKVLNTFCYTGGFSVYALQAGASLVHSVDASAKAIELTKQNIALNGFDPQVHTAHVADTFDFIRDAAPDGTLPYDVVILDPPAFAKHREARHQAMKGYQRLNAETMKRMKRGGIIFTFSCSQVVDRQLFYDTVVSAAVQTGRSIQVLEHLSQPADHPVSVYHPEGEYLKGLVLYIG